MIKLTRFQIRNLRDLSLVALDLRLDGHLPDDELVALQPQVVQLLLATVVVYKRKHWGSISPLFNSDFIPVDYQGGQSFKTFGHLCMPNSNYLTELVA